MQAATRSDTVPPGRDRGDRRRFRAFGLEIDAAFDAPGLTPAAGPPQGRPVRLDLATQAEIDGAWPAGGTRRVLEEHFDGGPPARTIDVHPEAGYRLYARHFGLARISPAGTEVICAPPDDEPWSWQRFLVGRVLPWAAVLRGHEVLHAAALGWGGRAIAVVGATGTGKTSVAVQLVTRGLEFFTDDVLALERRDGDIVAHPGAGIASIRDAERDAMPADILARLGKVLGHSGKTYLEIGCAARPQPLGALYFLARGHSASIEPLERVDPRLLLASTFVLGVQTPDRLLNQLETCSAIARAVPIFRLTTAAGLDATGTAELLHDHLRAGSRS
jgi:hypothetical protein